MTSDLSLKETQKEWQGTFKSYVMGFLASLLLTAISFSLVITKLFPEHILIYTILGLAIVQAIVQLLFFFTRRTRAQTALGDAYVLFYGISVIHYCWRIVMDYV